jgi:Predicted hydrolases of HD superfamily
MQDYSGIQEFYETFIKLEQIKRQGWVKRNIPAERIEDVSNHTLQCIMLGSVFCRELKLYYNLSRMLEMMFIHDVGEVIIGDAAVGDENYMEKKKREQDAVLTALGPLSSITAAYYYSLWKEFEEKSTPLGKFCYEVDKISAVMRAKQYSKEYDRPDVLESFYSHAEENEIFATSPLLGIFESLNPNKKRK